MDVFGFLIFFVMVLAQVFTKQTDTYGFIGAAIGLGLCAIAGAINNVRNKMR